MVMLSPVGKVTRSSIDSEMAELEDPSNSLRGIGGKAERGRLRVSANVESIKQWVEPQSTRVDTGVVTEVPEIMSGVIRDVGSERVDALSRISVQEKSTRSSACTGL
jgi:hypothetical protein